MNSTKEYAAVVVGAGHAGIEASLSIARAGFPVCVLTMDIESIGRMSCNPAIGGLAKGHMVREIDALGGEMGLATDATGIQFRMLNRSKGPAVWAPRAQADKKLYSEYMQRALKTTPNIDLKKGMGVNLLVKDGVCYGIQTGDGEIILSRTVILTTGTFLQGLIHIGETNYEGGRRDEPPAVGLSDSLRKNGIELVRFKTGTPPRLLHPSIDWSVTEEQKGDEPPRPFSFRTTHIPQKQISCYLTHTSAETHALIRDNLNRSPLYAGRIVGTGPRYCPSIEDKVVRFADKISHQIYLEPEGLDTDEVYVNGLSTSLPKDVQENMVHSIRGLENAKIVRYGYAIEYDAAPPTQLWHSLETKKIKNLFLAGQINCTSGYEEAAAQGLMAGLNVICKLKGRPPFVLDRSEAYIGVLIDDLVTRGTNEPYRMFTSRAEHRLVLRQDNADERLIKHGRELGLVSDETIAKHEQKMNRIQTEIKALKTKRHGTDTLLQILRRPEINHKYFEINKLHSFKTNEEETEIVETLIKYEGYVERQRKEVEKFKQQEKRKIPDTIEYSKVIGISKEGAEKLKKIRPESIGQALRIPGISHCDISLISIYVQKLAREAAK
ncbi:MAG TPA: tRNA uridine-5-carboxymethylaminomethyl(34) synthesis enzyme MnmG [Candidatus Omnitrophota bacterium]|mgnify:FL=1|nr:tRNA uridine-5-carboxymethylaminomethyl(34) synthesis enzyme MnmG [Candidatus Omnitrophota bacterium]